MKPKRLDLSQFSRLSLAHLPTPLEELERLGREIGASRLLIKRDDCTGLAFGGNKTRKLEFALADALAQGADTVITCGGVQSNHVRQTAAAAAKLGLACEAIIENPISSTAVAYTSSGNRLIDELCGARVHWHTDGDEELDAALRARVTALKAEGRRPYLVPMGASYGIGALGYVAAAVEILEQCHAANLQPSHLFLATGSAGTQAGLLAGLRLAGSATQVIGIAVSPTAESKRAMVIDIITQLAELLATEIPVRDDEVVVLDEWVGAGYGVPTRECLSAIRDLAQLEGILLDPVYTGKAMAGMLALLARSDFESARDVLFLHTGGAPSLFAYPDDLASDTAGTRNS